MEETMRVLLLGATGMVGQGVLRECLIDPEVQEILVVVRHPTAIQHPKLREIVHGDLFDCGPIETHLTGFDACMFCIGVSSVGMSEADYTLITYDFTKYIAETLLRLNPGLIFIYITGAGTDSSEKGRIMWARVKGKTENMLLQMPFSAAYMFRPGLIQPLHGIMPRSKVYFYSYLFLKPVISTLRKLFPSAISTTEELGQAYLAAAKKGFHKPVIEKEDIRPLLVSLH
jgi:uncharacterized protein YbjT (DUF2867 family)